MEESIIDGNTPPREELPEGNNDPGDPLNPDVEEENNTPAPPIGDPGEDMEVTGENEIDRDDPSDIESELSELDDRQFDDFDATAVAIEDRQEIAVDDSNVALLGRHKKRRVDGEEGRKERKEKRREKTKKPRRRRGDDDEMPDGEQLSGKRARKRKDTEDGLPQPVIEDDESLTPEEKRKRALDRAMDEALKRPSGARRKKRDGIDLDAMADAEIERMKDLMAAAADADNKAREQGQTATQKLKLLPQVMTLLNRTNLISSLVDPEINILQSVRFFLEPLNDGSLPAFNIQRQLFGVLGKLPIGKDALVASGIGKVVLFYTRSKKVEDMIKRQAERLLSEWMRPILKRTDDYRKREIAEATYDPRNPQARSAPPTQKDAVAAAREKALANPTTANYTLIPKANAYTVAPRSDPSRIVPTARAPGQTGEEAFRRFKARKDAQSGARSRR